jgi:hypothetical protein
MLYLNMNKKSILRASRQQEKENSNTTHSKLAFFFEQITYYCNPLGLATEIDFAYSYNNCRQRIISNNYYFVSKFSL